MNDRRLSGEFEGDDDGIRSRTICLSYINDTTAVIPYQDLQFFFDCLRALGCDLGCNVSAQKNEILTSTNNTSPMRHLSTQHANDLAYVLAEYCNGSEGEKTSGVRVLGTPIGNRQFVHEFQTKTIEKVLDVINSLHDTTNNMQSKFQILKTSIQLKLRYLQPSDVLHAHKSDLSDDGVTSTNFVGNSRSIIEGLIAGIMELDASEIKRHSWDIFYSPTSIGGGGILDPAHSSIGNFTVSIARSI